MSKRKACSAACSGASHGAARLFQTTQDLGIGGDRTQHVLWRLENGNIDGISPKLAVLMIGTNNCGSNTPEEIAEGVEAIVKKLRKGIMEQQGIEREQLVELAAERLDCRRQHVDPLLRARTGEVALRRVWHGERFSWWMSNMLHNFGDEVATGMDTRTFSRFMDSERDYYLRSEEGKTVIARQYVGLAYENI